MWNINNAMAGADTRPWVQAFEMVAKPAMEKNQQRISSGQTFFISPQNNRPKPLFPINIYQQIINKKQYKQWHNTIKYLQ